MKPHLLPPQQVESLIATCCQSAGTTYCDSHSNKCNQLALNCIINTTSSSYKTYLIVYIIQLLSNTKKLRNNPVGYLVRWFFYYVKSVSFTAVDMAIMRRVLCFYHNHVNTNAKGLIIANFLGGLYLAVQSKNRQIQITLYSLNKCIQTLYNCYKRRNPQNVNGIIPNGQALLFAISISMISYYYYEPAYQKVFGSIFNKT